MRLIMRLFRPSEARPLPPAMFAMRQEHELILNDGRSLKEADEACLCEPARKKILIVEDDASTRFLVRQILKCAGYDTLEANDGEAGLRMATEEMPDLVLVDGLLPRMHGFLVCKAIKALPNPPHVIVLTAVYKKITYRWQVKSEYGADELLVKPVCAAELISCIEKVLSEPEIDTPAFALGSNEHAAAAPRNFQVKA